MSHAQLLALLLPPASYSPTAPRIAAELSAEGAALDTALSSADVVANSIAPFYAGALLTDWERVSGLTPAVGAAYQTRLQAVLAKLAETGGLSIPYFKKLAAGLGYAIDIVEPQPFRAGAGRVGDTIYAPEVVWVWQVIVTGGSTARAVYFRAGSSVAGERLLDFQDQVIESLFEDLKPAHTFVYFAYLES